LSKLAAGVALALLAAQTQQGNAQFGLGSSPALTEQFVQFVRSLFQRTAAPQRGL
jgi:hypothetical protein